MSLNKLTSSDKVSQLRQILNNLSQSELEKEISRTTENDLSHKKELGILPPINSVDQNKINSFVDTLVLKLVLEDNPLSQDWLEKSIGELVLTSVSESKLWEKVCKIMKTVIYNC